MSTPPTIRPISTRLREARDIAHLSQAELAVQLGVSHRTVQGWEAGVYPQPRHRRRVLAFIAEVEDGQAA